MRILVTGSRDWKDVEAVENALTEVMIVARRLGVHVTIVHGACNTGADKIASDFVRLARLPWFTEERHPARWQKLGKKAGPIRNQKMVELGADVCLGFIHDDSRGTKMTLDMARKAGIKIQRYYE